MADATSLEVVGGGGSDANSLILTATSSFSSTLSSSDLDTQSIGSFFPERSITLGSLIGIARGVSAVADHDPSSLPRSSGTNRANRRANRTASSSVSSTPLNQGISCSHVSCIHDNAKLWSLLSCGACIYANHKGVGSGFCCAEKGESCIASSAPGPSSSSLGHFLIAERDADRDAERLSNEARVYINIMYEESRRMEDGAVNPLFDLDATPANVGTNSRMYVTNFGETQSPPTLGMQSHDVSGAAGVRISSCTGDEAFMVQAGTTSTQPHVEVVPRRTPSLRAKEQKGPDVCELGCVSNMWTGCRF